MFRHPNVEFGLEMRVPENAGVVTGKYGTYSEHKKEPIPLQSAGRKLTRSSPSNTSHAPPLSTNQRLKIVKK